MSVEGWRVLFDPAIGKFLLGGVAVTLELSISTIWFSLIVGLLIGGVRAARVPGLSPLLSAYVDVSRSIPTFLLVVYVYVGLPQLGVDVPPMVRVILALTIYHGSRISEVVRAGILSVARGQIDAARSLGLSYLKSMCYVVLPQAFKHMLPSLIQETVMVVKNTSLALWVGVVELLYRGQVIYNTHFNPVEALIVVGALYFLLCYGLSWAARQMEGAKLEEAL